MGGCAFFIFFISFCLPLFFLCSFPLLPLVPSVPGSLPKLLNQILDPSPAGPLGLRPLAIALLGLPPTMNLTVIEHGTPFDGCLVESHITEIWSCCLHSHSTRPLPAQITTGNCSSGMRICSSRLFAKYSLLELNPCYKPNCRSYISCDCSPWWSLHCCAAAHTVNPNISSWVLKHHFTAEIFFQRNILFCCHSVCPLAALCASCASVSWRGKPCRG